MVRKYTQRYVPVTIESRHTNGDWSLRNNLEHENAKVISGERPRSWLVELARHIMINWTVNYEHNSKELRVTGLRRGE